MAPEPTHAERLVRGVVREARVSYADAHALVRRAGEAGLLDPGDDLSDALAAVLGLLDDARRRARRPHIAVRSVRRAAEAPQPTPG